MARREFTEESKIEAVRLAENSNVSMAENGDVSMDEVTHELGIHPNTLCKWRR